MFPKFYKVIIAVILITDQCTNSFENSSHQDWTFKNDDHSDILLSSKYKRQLTNETISCKIPKNLFHTKYQILGKSETRYRAGDYVQTATVLNINCNNGYILISPIESNLSVCVNGEWEPSPTTCRRSCPPLVSSVSTTVRCVHKGISLDNCLNSVDETNVILSCTPFYEEASLDRNPIRVCRNGRWNPSISQCYPSCGMKVSKGAPNVIGGKNATPGDYPWQVGVYDIKKDLICGGAIIDQHAVLSAAHCFTDHNGNIQATENYFIATGKYYREYNDDRDVLAQYSNVMKIYVPEQFKGYNHFYGHDIAVIILSNPFTFSEVVQPVCVELNEKIQLLHLSSNDNGIVTGWGQTEEGGNLSEILKELVVPFVPYQKCYEEVPRNFRKYITFDKICGGYTNRGMSICRGDSGGALAFKNIANDRYYLKGIVSTSPSMPSADIILCNSNTYSVYTGISHHIEFIRSHVQYHQLQQPVEYDYAHTEVETNKGCLFLNFPLNGKYILLQPVGAYKPGDSVPTGSIMSIYCDIGYKANYLRTIQSHCVENGKWIPSLGRCEKFEVKPKGNHEEPTILPPDVSNHKNINLLPKECGVFTPANRIRSWNISSLYEFPWMARLSNGPSSEDTPFAYEGTIINNRYILTTAAACFISQYVWRHSFVRVGEYNLKSEPDCIIIGNGLSRCADPVEDIEIEACIPHPDHRQELNDIGLIRLKKPIQFKESVQPICLPTNDELRIENFTNTHLIKSGWGFSGRGGKPISDLLTRKTVSIRSQLECQNLYSTINITHFHLCTDNEPESDCPYGGDGRPLQGAKLVFDDLQYVQFGIASYGSPICQKGPGLYTRIDYFMDWILDTIKI